MLNKQKIFICLLLVSLGLANLTFSKEPAEPGAVRLENPALVNALYSGSPKHLLWFSEQNRNPEIRAYFLGVLDSAEFIGLDKERYHYDQLISTGAPVDSAGMATADRLLTDALVTYAKDVYQGHGITGMIINDEISSKFMGKDNDYVLAKVKDVSALTLGTMLAGLEPEAGEYSVLKEELRKQITAGNGVNVRKLKACLNLYRWIHHFRFAKSIVVNIPAIELKYYERNELKGNMKVVVGKPLTKSPRFSTWCYEVVLYPYWNVPRSIAVKELFPHFKRNPGALKTMNMQVIDKGGREVDPGSIDWSKYNGRSFPYGFRQCTGCDNSLGVIKFNLTDPFSVYLHDTNFKLAFLKDTRFLSHGCIRVEKPLDLGNFLLDNKLDSNLLKSCIKGHQPVPIELKSQVPVFVVYMPVVVRGDSVVYCKDVYRLFK